WLPWTWWALEYARQTRHGWLRFLPAGLFIYLLITAGWPWTILMAGFLTLWLVAQTIIRQRRVVPLWTMAPGGVVGLGLSGPAWMMLLEYSPHTVRGQTSLLVRDNAWMVPWDSLPGFIFPELVSMWNVYIAWKPHQCTELCGGLVPLAILVVA